MVVISLVLLIKYFFSFEALLFDYVVWQLMLMYICAVLGSYYTTYLLLIDNSLSNIMLIIGCSWIVNNKIQWIHCTLQMWSFLLCLSLCERNELCESILIANNCLTDLYLSAYHFDQIVCFMFEVIAIYLCVYDILSKNFSKLSS